MTSPHIPDMNLKRIPSTDYRLGRHVVHDPRSRSYSLLPPTTFIDREQWRSKKVRVYDPRPNPNQCHGECGGVSKCIQLNAVGNRRKGRVLNMDDAHKIYSLATTLDPWPGSYPPIDTGTSALATCKAAQELGYGGPYWWIFNGADGIIAAIQKGWTVNCGTNWENNMFYPDPNQRGLVTLGGGNAGGHLWTAIGYDRKFDEVIGVCWWGEGFREFRISRTDLDILMADDGDAHVQETVG